MLVTVEHASTTPMFPVTDSAIPGPEADVQEEEAADDAREKETDDCRLQTRYDKLQREHSEALETIAKMKQVIASISEFASDIASTAASDLSEKINAIRSAIADDAVGSKRARADEAVYIA